MATKNSSKGKFIKKFYEHAKIDKLKEVPGRKKKGTGIYALYNEGGLYYIGLSERSLHGRLMRHTKDKHSGKWDNFSYYQIKILRYIKDVETLLLKVARPTGNYISGRFPRKNNVKKNKQPK